MFAPAPGPLSVVKPLPDTLTAPPVCTSIVVAETSSCDVLVVVLDACVSVPPFCTVMVVQLNVDVPDTEKNPADPMVRELQPPVNNPAFVSVAPVTVRSVTVLIDPLFVKSRPLRLNVVLGNVNVPPVLVVSSGRVEPPPVSV